MLTATRTRALCVSLVVAAMCGACAGNSRNLRDAQGPPDQRIVLDLSVADPGGAAAQVGAPISGRLDLPEQWILLLSGGAQLELAEVPAPSGGWNMMTSQQSSARMNAVDWSLAVPAQFVPEAGLVDQPAEPGRGRIAFLMPPGEGEMRRFRVRLSRDAPATPTLSVAADYTTGMFDMHEGPRRVLRYAHGSVPVPEGIDPSFERGDYVSQLFGPYSEPLLEDYARDHEHHRALGWSWATVRWRGETRDPYWVKGCWHRPSAVAGLTSGPVVASITAVSLWMWDDAFPIVRETVRIDAWRSDKRRARCIDFDVSLEPLVADVEFCGRLEAGYSGFHLRMQPAAGPAFVAHIDGPASSTRRAWADYSARFSARDRRSGVAMLQNVANPAYPHEWRHYPGLNYWQPIYPGGELIEMPAGRGIRLRYRLWVHGDDATAEELAAHWSAYNEARVPAVYEESPAATPAWGSR